MDARLCALCECLSHLLSLSHDSILADTYSANPFGEGGAAGEAPL
jgi:hypothetical protein